VPLHGRLAAKLRYENTFEYGFILDVTSCRGKNKIKFRLKTNLGAKVQRKIYVMNVNVAIEETSLLSSSGSQVVHY
jgi:hypothetical protein